VGASALIRSHPAPSPSLSELSPPFVGFAAMCVVSVSHAFRKAGRCSLRHLLILTGQISPQVTELLPIPTFWKFEGLGHFLGSLSLVDCRPTKPD